MSRETRRRSTSRRTARLLLCQAAVLGAVVIGGCVAAPPREGVAAAPGKIGGFGLERGRAAEGWATVLPGPAAVAAEAAFSFEPEADRRDDSLAVREVERPTAAEQWPDVSRPRMDRRIYIYVPRRTHSYMFFEHERTRRVYYRRRY